MAEHEDTIEEIRQIVNKAGVPHLLDELLVILGLDEDYKPESSESDEEVSDDDIVEEMVTVHKKGEFYKLVDD